MVYVHEIMVLIGNSYNQLDAHSYDFACLFRDKEFVNGGGGRGEDLD